MTKEQWQQTVRVMKLKWPNFHWSNDQVKSAYDSLKDIDVAFVEKAKGALLSVREKIIVGSVWLQTFNEFRLRCFFLLNCHFEIMRIS